MESQAYFTVAQSELEKALSKPAHGLRPVIYSGPGSPSLDFYTALEAHGLSVVGDDADFGTRTIGPDVDASLEPIEAIAKRYANRSPAPAGWGIRERVQWLVDLTRTRAAQAVIFDLPTWSHPPAWDLPAERRALEALGIPCIMAPQTAAAEAAQSVAHAFESLQGAGRAHV
jgi:benzoyl-CoA reductase/2-hydroxyglutaryl-CoA dehydratase subunit BcrC/BadD/HgdB